MNPMHLLAKSAPGVNGGNEKPPSSAYLATHLRDVFHSASAVLDCTGEEQLHALGLHGEGWLARFQTVVTLAAALHDLGKANDHFQGMIQGDDDRKIRRQGLRHEWVTSLILENPSMKGWLSPVVNENDWRIIRWTITGHHPARHHESPPISAPDGGGSTMSLFTGHQDFRKVLDWIREEFDLETPPEIKNESIRLTGCGNAFDQIGKTFREDYLEWRRFDREERRFTAAAKACLIAADVAGSALPRMVDSSDQRKAWIRESFGRRPAPAQLNRLIEERLAGAGGGYKSELRPFQRQAAERAGDVTFIKAGCGTGKTLAAYHWAAERCPGRRLYVCYPTTGTATEGFRDYLFNPDEGNAKYGADLFHSRADVDWDLILGNGGDGRNAEDLYLRIASLRSWSTPIVSCTTDTVLGLTQNHRSGLYAWPALAGSAFVFDEIHAYDDRLYGALLRFLETLHGAPVLLMTASLPRHRYEQLERTMKLRGGTFETIPGPVEMEKIRRYHFDGYAESGPFEAVQREIEKGGKVLWVCNTVGRAMDFAQRAQSAGLFPMLYHSRFKYEDRIRRHANVIESFRGDAPALAICTQVAEMSLDLSASLLVTDLAPVPALIQRLGRLNRRARPGDPIRPFIAIEPIDPNGNALALPYDSSELETARRWLANLSSADLSQDDLSNAWESEMHTPKNGHEKHTKMSWPDGGPCTKVVELREGSPGITVLMAEDIPRLRNGESPNRMALPMPPPKGFDWQGWRRWKNAIPIAPEGSIEYDETRGAKWRNG